MYWSHHWGFRVSQEKYRVRINGDEVSFVCLQFLYPGLKIPTSHVSKIVTVGYSFISSIPKLMFFKSYLSNLILFV